LCDYTLGASLLLEVVLVSGCGGLRQGVIVWLSA